MEKMYEDFDASFAANEGLAAVLRDLKPSRRRLKVNRLGEDCYLIECEQGGKMYLTSTDTDSLILSFDRRPSDEESPSTWAGTTLLKRQVSSAMHSKHIA